MDAYIIKIERIEPPADKEAYEKTSIIYEQRLPAGCEIPLWRSVAYLNNRIAEDRMEGGEK